MRRAAALVAALAGLLLAACAGAPPAAPPAGPGATPPSPGAEQAPPPAGEAPFAALAARFTSRALRLEQAGEPRAALESWQVVAALRPGAAEPARRVADLGARLAVDAARHYAEGLARLKEGAVDAARRSFLLALAADPAHVDALDALKNRLEPESAAHTVAPGETFEAIAKRHYGDGAKAAIVARVNGLDPAGRPVPGSVLAIPSLAPSGKQPAGARPGAGTAEAAEAPGAAYETEPAAIAPEAPAAPVVPAAPAARPAPPRAVEAPPGPDPAELARQNRERAEEYYNAGVRFFINQQLDEAIKSWERTLALYPGHPKAPRDIEKARALQQKLRDIR